MIEEKAVCGLSDSTRLFAADLLQPIEPSGSSCGWSPEAKREIDDRINRSSYEVDSVTEWCPFAGRWL
ncbi:hypothetical protein J6590_027283 [Homalodisca vitripennis]|nr:hypothetical protein J6590_027283 [Homalodisca vitripennis]